VWVAISYVSSVSGWNAYAPYLLKRRLYSCTASLSKAVLFPPWPFSLAAKKFLWTLRKIAAPKM